MSLDIATVRRIASLARIRMEEDEVARMQTELNGILGWIEQLQAVPTEGVEPMAGGGVAPEAHGDQAAPEARGNQAMPEARGNQAMPEARGSQALRLQEDLVTDGGGAEAVLANAPDREQVYFGVPKVVE